jgi:Tyrosine-protein kinase ephrin type A/B receptor-like
VCAGGYGAYADGTCTICELGTYSSGGGTSACVSCSAGTTTFEYGSMSPAQCNGTTTEESLIPRCVMVVKRGVQLIYAVTLRDKHVLTTLLSLALITLRAGGLHVISSVFTAMLLY